MDQTQITSVLSASADIGTIDAIASINGRSVYTIILAGTATSAAEVYSRLPDRLLPCL